MKYLYVVLANCSPQLTFKDEPSAARYCRLQNRDAKERSIPTLWAFKEVPLFDSVAATGVERV